MNTCIARERFSRNLKTLRQLKQKTVKTVAEETGFSYSYLIALENKNNKRNPSMETLDRLAIYYKVDISIFFLP